MNWTRSARPKECGGLGILHMSKFARAMRLRWLWQDWVSRDKMWVTSELPCTATDRLLFAASTTILIGDGRKTSFWESAWIQGLRPRDLAPRIFSISRRKNRTIYEALQNNNWIRDLNFQAAELTAHHFIEYCKLWIEVQKVRLCPETQDNIVWKLSRGWTVLGAFDL